VPGAREVVAVSAAGGVERLRFERPTARTTLRPAAHDRTPGKLAVSADGALLATLSYGTVEVLDLRTGARRWSYQRHDGASVAFRGARLFGVHHDAAAVVAVIHGLDGRRLAEVKLESTSPLAVSGAGDALAALDTRGGLVIRDLDFAKCGGKTR
jgi:outer membrane protein assembly factor BamB